MKVFVVGGDTLVREMFQSKGFSFSKNTDSADIVVLTGGADVSPEYYGEYKMQGTNTDPKRDRAEADIFDSNPSKFFVGICRGGQFLNVLSGGRLYQDVNNHTKNHNVYTKEGNFLCEVTSTHHQMMIPHHSARILAVARESTTRKRARGIFIGSPFLDDNEVVYYPDNKDRNGVLCFQPHPEYGHEDTKTLFFESLKATNKLVKEFLTPKESA